MSLRRPWKPGGLLAFLSATLRTVWASIRAACDFFPKGKPTLAVPRAEALFVTEAQTIAPPRVMVRTLPGQDVPLRPPRRVAAGRFGGDGARGGVSGVAKLAMKVRLLITN